MLSGSGEEDLNKGCFEEKDVIKVTSETAKPSETDTITKNMDIENSIKNSPHAVPNPDRIPSPDMNFINSPLERNELTSPLHYYFTHLF